MHRVVYGASGFALLLAFGFALQSLPAEAATTTATFDVTANVAVSCTMTAAPLGFGVYDPHAGTPLDAQSNLSVDCTNGANFDIELDRGLHGASVTTREMANNSAPSVLLQYSLFSDPARTQNWGQTEGVDDVDGTGTGSTQQIGVYGRIPAGQTTATAGGYADTITATLTF